MAGTADERDDIDDFFDDLLKEPLFDAPPTSVPAVAASTAPNTEDLDPVGLSPVQSSSQQISAIEGHESTGSDAPVAAVAPEPSGDGGASDPDLASDAKLFRMDDPSSSPASAAPRTPAGLPPSLDEMVSGAASADADDWYEMDAHVADKQLQEARATTVEQRAAPEKEGNKMTSWASAFRKKAASKVSESFKEAKSFGVYAKKAVAEEWKIVQEEARDLAKGVQEGVALTAEDTAALRERMSREAKTKGWGGLLNLGSGGATASATASGSDVCGVAEAASSTATPATTSVASASAAASSDEGACAVTGAVDDLLGDASIIATSDPLLEAVAASSADSADDKPKSQETGTRPKGSALDALKQGLAVTKEVSRDMWKDLREVNQEVLTDIRQNLGDVKSVLKAIPAVVQEGVSNPTAAGQASLVAANSPLVHESTGAEALDALLGEPLVGPPSSSTEENVNPAAVAEAAQRRVKEVAKATVQASGELWKDIHAGFKEVMSMVPGVDQVAFEDVGEYAIGAHDFCSLPSTRANYVLVVPRPTVVTDGVTFTGDLQSVSSPSSGAGASAANPFAADAVAAADAAGAAVHRQAELAAAAARKFGGKLAKRSQEAKLRAAEVSSGFMKQARDLGQKIEANTASAVRTRGSATNAAASADAVSDTAGIFEIGSDSDDLHGDASDGEAFDDGADDDGELVFQPPARPAQTHQTVDDAGGGDAADAGSLLD